MLRVRVICHRWHMTVYYEHDETASNPPPSSQNMKIETPNFVIEDLNDMEPVDCPCGKTRRAFTSPDNDVATLHMVDIQTDAQTHYHKKLTEIYLILEGEGHMELDGELYPVKPMTTIFIRPGCRHRAIGNLRIVNIPIPAFDPNDEWFD